MPPRRDRAKPAAVEAELSATSRGDVLRYILRGARRWELRGELPNGARIRIVNVGDTQTLRQLLDVVDES